MEVDDMPRDADNTLETPAPTPEWILALTTLGDLPALRSRVKEHLIAHGRPDLVEDGRLVATELATNAFLHGGDGVYAHGWKSEAGIVVAVADGGVGDATRIRLGSIPDRNQVGGRGLLLVAALATVEVRITNQGTTVAATLR